jgi:hypothetical protein
MTLITIAVALGVGFVAGYLTGSYTEMQARKILIENLEKLMGESHED